jgi:hypothetical protein
VSVLALLDLLFGHVTEGHQILWNLNLEVEGRLEVWFVPARDCPPPV